MYPKLYNANETNFIHNGLGLLTGTISAIATEELNGMFELNMEYDSEGFLADVIQEEMIIKAKANDKQEEQLFRIYSITKNHENDNLIIAGQHVTYDLGNNFVEELHANNLTKKQVMELIGSSTAYPHPFDVTSTNTTTQSSTNLYRTNPLRMIGGMEGSVLQIWGGQIERDNFRLVMHDRRGSDDGVLVIYKKNLTGLNAEFDISSLKTRIFPFVYKEATEDEPEQLITVPGKYIDSPHIDDYEMPYILPVDFSSEEGIETSQDLLKVASSWFEETGRDKPKVEMEVQFEHLWETEEYKDVAVLELVGMGDTITVRHGKLKVEGTAIVNRIEYDVLAEKNIAVDVGNVKASFTDKVNDVGRIIDKVDEIDKNANQAIRAVNGKNTIYYGPDEPTTGNVDDIWFRVVDGEYTRTYRYDGIQWQLIVSADVKDIEETANSAHDRADEAVEKANLATSNANEALAEAQTAFDKAQESLSTAEGLTSRMQSVEGNITTINQTTESYGRRIENAEGDISTLSNTAQGLQNRITNAEGDISSVTQLANTLQTRMKDAEGNINILTQTASSLDSAIKSVKYDLENLDGRNLLKQTENLNGKFGSGYQGAKVTYTKVDMSEEWGFPEAYRLDTSGGTNTIKALYISANYTTEPLVLEENYTYSIYIKNVGNNTVRVYLNGLSPTGGGQGEDIAPGVSKRVILHGKRRKDYDWFQPRFQALNVSDSLSFIIAREQLQRGPVTGWQPSPEDAINYTQSQISQLAENINLRVMKGDVINQINIDTSGVLISGKKLILDGDTTVTGTFRVGNANITSIDAGKLTTGVLDAGQVTLINLRGLDIYGSRFRSSTGTDFMEITGGNIRLQNANNRYLQMSPTGFYGYNAGGSVRFQADAKLVTSAALGTSNLNVYLAADDTGEVGEVRTVKWSTLGGGGSSTDYDYIDIRTRAIRSPIGRHFYIGTDGGELRVMSQGLLSSGVYRDVRASVYYGAGFRTTSTSLWMGTDSAMHVVNKGYLENSSGSPTYRDIYARRIYNTAMITSTDNAYIGADSELRVVNKGLGSIYRDVRAAKILGNVFAFNSSLGGKHIYIRPGGSDGEVRITAPGSTSSYRSLRTSKVYETSSEKFKRDIRKFEGSALDLINQSVIYDYEKEGVNGREIGLVIERETPSCIVDGDAVDGYSMRSLSWKAIQELDDNLNLTKEELVLKIAKLEARINKLEAA
ncbi:MULTISPECIES: phage tail spike protein [unclassified Oceanobacillus]|uniref:phage tail spike protein n=1 Tax=unclassified Oceanobacillus TaxID=2630292 RepID=UPI00300DE31A